MLNSPFLGVWYTDAQLKAWKEMNHKGCTIEGRHYSLYEATQMQRKMERSIRKQKKRILVDKATGDEEKLQIDQTKLRMQNANYKKFSDAAGLRTQRERAQVAGFGRKEAEEASRAPTALPKCWKAVVGWKPTDSKQFFGDFRTESVYKWRWKWYNSIKPKSRTKRDKQRSLFRPRNTIAEAQDYRNFKKIRH